MITINLKVVGDEDVIKKFKDYLISCGVKINIGLRSSGSNNSSTLHLVVSLYSSSSFSSIISTWFVNNGDALIISGDKDSVNLPDMDEIIFSHNDPLVIINKKVDELIDRQMYYDSFNKKDFRKSRRLQ